MNLRIGTPLPVTVNPLKFAQVRFQICLKYRWCNANSADPDQTAPKEQSDLGQLCFFLTHLSNIKVIFVAVISP